MICIFLEKGERCAASISKFAPSQWTIDGTTMKKYCLVETFSDCPRYKAYMDYLAKIER